MREGKGDGERREEKRGEGDRGREKKWEEIEIISFKKILKRLA